MKIENCCTIIIYSDFVINVLKCGKNLINELFNINYNDGKSARIIFACIKIITYYLNVKFFNVVGY